MQLTNFAKILIIVTISGCFLLGAVAMCVNCKSCVDQSQTTSYRQPVQDYGDYQVVSQPDGQQVVVVKDNDGSEFFMNYLMWQTIFNSQGISGVRGYYSAHRYDPDWGTQQTSYRSSTKTVINNYYGQQVDDSKPLSDQIKYNQSKGFGKKSISPTTVNDASKSKGFTGKWFESSEKTTTPSPSYKPSSGFGSSSKSSTYKPSSGFGSSSSSSSYKPSSGFGSSSRSSTYKPSSGFGSSPKSSTSSSRGFGKKQ